MFFIYKNPLSINILMFSIKNSLSLKPFDSLLYVGCTRTIEKYAPDNVRNMGGNDLLYINHFLHELDALDHDVLNDNNLDNYIIHSW